MLTSYVLVCLFSALVWGGHPGPGGMTDLDFIDCLACLDGGGEYVVGDKHMEISINMSVNVGQDNIWCGLLATVSTEGSASRTSRLLTHVGVVWG